MQAMLLAAEKPGSGVNHAVIAGNVSTMLLGGQETTASALAWLGYGCCGSIRRP